MERQETVLLKLFQVIHLLLLILFLVHVINRTVLRESNKDVQLRMRLEPFSAAMIKHVPKTPRMGRKTIPVGGK